MIFFPQGLIYYKNIHTSVVFRQKNIIELATSTREHDGLSSKSVVNLLGINETRANESVAKCVMPQAISSSQTRERRQTCLRIPIRSSALSYSFWGMDDVRAMPLALSVMIPYQATTLAPGRPEGAVEQQYQKSKALEHFL